MTVLPLCPLKSHESTVCHSSSLPHFSSLSRAPLSLKTLAEGTRWRREEAAVIKQICTREERVSWGRDQEVDALDPRPRAAGALVEGDREIQVKSPNG